MEDLISFMISTTFDFMCSDYLMYLTGALAIIMILNTIYNKILGRGNNK